MVSGYWFGIHKVSGTGETAQSTARMEASPVIAPAAIAPELTGYDFSDLHCDDTGDQSPSSVFDAQEMAARAPEPAAPYSWIGLDLRANPDTTPPAAKDSSATA
jgi:hypothetical protein